MIRFVPFVLKHLRRNTVRTASTTFALALCILLFCTLQSALARFDRVVDTRSPRRLVTRNAVTFMIPVPQAFRTEIASVPGVRRVAIMNGFGGVLPARREGKDAGGGEDLSLVQWMRFGQGGQMQMLAIVKKSAWNEMFPKLRQIRDGIELTR